MNNLTIVNNSDPNIFVATVARMGLTEGHFTNGVFAGPPEILLPTNLAYFQMMEDRTNSGAFIIAINSDDPTNMISINFLSYYKGLFPYFFIAHRNP